MGLEQKIYQSPKGKEEESGTESVFEEIMAYNFPNLKKFKSISSKR